MNAHECLLYGRLGQGGLTEERPVQRHPAAVKLSVIIPDARARSHFRDEYKGADSALLRSQDDARLVGLKARAEYLSA